MSIFAKKIDDITIEDIEKFISEKHPENIRLEYKQGLSSKDANFQIAKEVAAFANQQGGVILFGVAEDEKTRRPLSIEGVDKTLKLRERIQSVCIDHIYPPIVPEIQECDLRSDSSKAIVLVRVDMSDAVPHTINNRTGFYIRSQDRCDPREMTEEEIGLLWNRRARLVERREYLLKRTYDRVFAVGKTRETIPNPKILISIPLYPMKPLMDRLELLDIHKKSAFPQSEGFPLYSDRIKTAMDSLYCYFPYKEESQSIGDIGKERYGEISIFGQISYFENAIHTWKEDTGISFGYELRKLFLMAKYMANFYQTVGYWGIVHFVLSIQNCLGHKIYPPFNMSYFRDKISEIEVDADIKIERDYSVSEIVKSPEAMVVDVMTELLWGTGLSVYQASEIPMRGWLERVKIDMYGKKQCPVCKRDIANVDEMCLECRSKAIETTENTDNKREASRVS